MIFKSRFILTLSNSLACPLWILVLIVVKVVMVAVVLSVLSRDTLSMIPWPCANTAGHLQLHQLKEPATCPLWNSGRGVVAANWSLCSCVSLQCCYQGAIAARQLTETAVLQRMQRYAVCIDLSLISKSIWSLNALLLTQHSVRYMCVEKSF